MKKTRAKKGKAVKLLNYPTILSPMTEAISVQMKNILANEAGSWNTNIPRMTVSTAPIPVHTGYAVLMGSTCVAFASKTMLIMRHIMNPAPHSHHAVVPATSFILPRQKANPASKQPAIISIAQLQFTCMMCALLYITTKTAAKILVINETAGSIR